VPGRLRAAAIRRGRRLASIRSRGGVVR
jgi:hypothetical protein